MNVAFFDESLGITTYCGQRLSYETAAFLENSLIILQSENKFRNIFFWGRLNGIELDYYIAFGYMKDCLRGRRFFYSKNAYEWFLLPPPNPEYELACILAPEKFTGDPSIITEVILDPKFILDPTGKYAIPSKPDKVKIKEEDRIACTINMITEESALLPRGALYKRLDRKTVYSPFFRGLNQQAATKLFNYQLYRMPREKWNYNLLKRQNYNYPTDFFDTIDSIIPEDKTFALSIEKDRGIVFLKSLFWPGMSFYHKCNSKKHGFYYFGDGRKNLDILFMI